MEGIYLIKNTKTNKVYIGSSIKLKARKRRHFKDLREQKHHSNKLQNSYNKHGKDCFTFETIETYDEIDYDKLLEREQYWMDYYDCYNKGYNCRPKAESNYGHVHTEETKKIMSENNKGEKNGMYGKSHSEETKQKLREAMLGRVVSEETREKKRIIGLGRTHTEESKLKQSRAKKSRPIYQLDLEGNIIKEWYSKREPLRELGFHIHTTLKGKSKFGKGFLWVYVDEYDLFIKNFRK